MRLRVWLALGAMIILSGQAAPSGCATTAEQRCKGYRAALVAAELLPQSEERTQRIAKYEKLVETWCP